MNNHASDERAAVVGAELPLPEDSVDAVRGIAEMLYCMRDAFWSNGVRGDNKPAGRGADFLARELSRHIDVIEDALFPGRRHLE